MSHKKWIQRAVELARQSKPEAGRDDKAPAVGAVVVKDGAEVAYAYRGMCGEGCHAEYCALRGLDPALAEGATVYTTLEPCSRRSATKTPCAQRLIDAKVNAVFIGLYDPNPKIYREGWKMLRDAGIELRDFPEEFRSELKELNADFEGQYRVSKSNVGSATFDYIHSPNFTIGDGHSQIETRWSHAASGVVHAYGGAGHIALARYAKAIGEIDDPSAMDFKHEVYAVTASNGDVVVFKSPLGSVYGIVQIDRVLSLDRKDDRNEISFTYEIRETGSKAT